MLKKLLRYLFPKPIRRDYPKNWNAIRHTVFRRDQYTCQDPDCSGFGRPLHCHHVVPVSKGGTHRLSNLITLCELCHKKHHPHMIFNSDWDFEIRASITMPVEEVEELFGPIPQEALEAGELKKTWDEYADSILERNKKFLLEFRSKTLADSIKLRDLELAEWRKRGDENKLAEAKEWWAKHLAEAEEEWTKLTSDDWQTCPDCEEWNKRTNKFCFNCGEELDLD